MDILRKLFLSKDALKKFHLLGEERFVCGESINFDKVLQLIGDIKSVDSNVKIGKDVFTDVELLTSYNGDNDTVFSSIDNTELVGSKVFLKTILINPIDNIRVLKKRQNVVKFVHQNIKTNTEEFKQLKELENDVLWLFSQDDEELNMLYDMVYYTNVFLKPLNKVDVALTSYNVYRIVLSPMIGLFTPIFYFVIPYIIVRIKLGVNITFFNYVQLMFQGIFSGGAIGNIFPKLTYLSTAFSLLFYFQGLFNSLEVAKACYKISKLITDRMHNVSKFLSISSKLLQKNWSPDISNFFSDIQGIPEISKHTNILQPFGLFSNFGMSLNEFRSFDKQKTLLGLKQIYILDSINSICRLIDSCGWSYTIYKKTKKPLLNVNGVWHPSLKGNIVKNILLLENKSLVLTGPNAGGKSTLIKSLLLSIIFSQTLGIVNADKLIMSPFTYINSQINIPDCKGKESLFEAEMNRSKENLDFLSEFNDGLSIIFMDEIFNSTNPIEGIAGAYAIAKNLSNYQSNIIVFTTHYLYLTKLAKEFPDRFINMKMNVKNIGNGIQYPYTISKGVSRQYIALELLKQNGFNKSIIEDALLIKQNLLRQK